MNSQLLMAKPLLKRRKSETKRRRALRLQRMILVSMHLKSPKRVSHNLLLPKMVMRKLKRELRARDLPRRNETRKRRTKVQAVSHMASVSRTTQRSACLAAGALESGSRRLTIASLCLSSSLMAISHLVRSRSTMATTTCTELVVLSFAQKNNFLSRTTRS